MKFDWTHYLSLAEVLAKTTDPQADIAAVESEARLRCSVSRAYYAAFCKARNYLRDVEGDTILDDHRNLIRQGKGAHRYVIEEFLGDKKNKKRVEIGRDLERLFADRKAVDYKDAIVGLNPKTVVALKLAQNIIASLDELER